MSARTMRVLAVTVPSLVLALAGLACGHTTPPPMVPDPPEPIFTVDGGLPPPAPVVAPNDAASADPPKP